MKHIKFWSLLAALLLMFSLTACTQGKDSRNKEKSSSATSDTQIEEQATIPSADMEEEAAAPELENRGQLSGCFKTPERTKYVQEEGIPKTPDEIGPEERDRGYVVDYFMGLSYYKPEAWRELEANSVMTDSFGNEFFDEEPIYAGKAFYYVTPALAMEFEALAAIDTEMTETKEWEDNLKAQRAPLFTLILYRTDKLRDDLTSVMEGRDFPVREVIKAHGDLTLVMGMGAFDENYCGDLFMPDYESLYEGVKTIYESLNVFPPESYSETLTNRVVLDFKTRDLRDEKASDKDLRQDKNNLVLVWTSNFAVSVKAFEELDGLRSDGKLNGFGTASILINKSTETITEEERAQLLRRFADSDLSILLKDPSMEEGFTRFLSRYPTYLLIDKKGHILDAHAGYLTPDALQDFLSK